MKKTICIALAVAVLLICAGCGSTRAEGLSDRAYERALAALETADEYIASTITGDKALENLDRALALIESCDGENDILLETAVFNLRYAISQKDQGTGTMSKVEDLRDSLADLLGK